MRAGARGTHRLARDERRTGAHGDTAGGIERRRLLRRWRHRAEHRRRGGPSREPAQSSPHSMQ